MCSNVEVEMLRDEMQKLQDKQTFVSSWDPETMLPPFTDVIMEATDGRSVHSHVSTLVGTSEAPGPPPWTLSSPILWKCRICKIILQRTWASFLCINCNNLVSLKADTRA
jgi:hypothetical protein